MIQDLWGETVASAMSGRPLGQALPQTIPAPPERKPEDELLYRIAAVGIYGLAGAGLKPADAFKARGEIQEGDCPLGAAALLSSLLREASDFPLVREWVAEAARRGIPVPLESAKRVAKAYKAKGETPPAGAILDWIGWKATSDEAPEQAFSTTSGAERAKALRRWRANDPEAARNAVAETLKDENAGARAALIGCLSENLSPADEAFLVQVVSSDRSSEVRNTAKAVLLGLPDSALSTELAAKVRERVKSSIWGKADLDPPDKDGPIPQDWLSEQGVHLYNDASRRTCVFVASAPLKAWADKPATKWIESSKSAKWSSELRLGWAVAAKREASKEWALALATSLKGAMDRQDAATIASLVLPLLDANSWEAVVGELLRECDLDQSEAVLKTAPHALWTGRFTDKVLEALPRLIDRHVAQRWYGAVPLGAIAWSADPACADRLSSIADRWDTENTARARDQVRDAAGILTRRRSIPVAFDSRRIILPSPTAPRRFPRSLAI